MSKKNKKTPADIEPCVMPAEGVPDDSLEYINKYGTYEIQPTNGMENDLPSIAQGYPKSLKKPDRENSGFPPSR